MGHSPTPSPSQAPLQSELGEELPQPPGLCSKRHVPGPGSGQGLQGQSVEMPAEALEDQTLRLLPFHPAGIRPLDIAALTGDSC